MQLNRSGITNTIQEMGDYAVSHSLVPLEMGVNGSSKSLILFLSFYSEGQNKSYQGCLPKSTRFKKFIYVFNNLVLSIDI